MSDFRGHFEIARAFLEIDEKFESMEAFVPKTAYDMQILSLFSQYMVVLITRTIEGSVKNIIFTKSKLSGKNENEIKEIENQLKKFQNPSKEKIYYYFNNILDMELYDYNFDNSHFTALGQIVNDRNKIAHSDPFLETIQHLKSLNEVKKHYSEIKKFVSKLCELTSC